MVRKTGLAIGLAIAVAVFAASGVAFAAIPDSGTGTFHGCVNKATGLLRLIDPTPPKNPAP